MQLMHNGDCCLRDSLRFPAKVLTVLLIQVITLEL